MNPIAPQRLDAIDRRLIKATQAGLPLTPRPYHSIGDAIGIDGADVMARLKRMQESGVVRRIGAVPNHYRLGYAANGMSVWDVADENVVEAGAEVGRLDFVSHCYHRPRHLPLWPYNLFAMVHGHSRDEVATKVAEIARLLAGRARRHEVLYSSKILKKTGLRLSDQGAP
ncbi:MAG: AsnC family transcriptional regulator [Defluviicoccus sp.]|nr:AsnC family transcriptional regulator [Defluviicoccus sp.]MDG4608118.1 AsnC family transcriptional regulator [Defluviicoccus sp.]